MSHSIAWRLSTAALPAALLLLTGCGSGRDSALAEKLARAEQAAQRAEAAQKAAELAASSAGAKLQQINTANAGDAAPAEEVEHEQPIDTAGAEIGPPNEG